jgi:hypothetical protein
MVATRRRLKQQAQHEREVIEAGEDVLHAEHHVCGGDLAHAALVFGRAVQLHRRLRRGERVDPRLAVEPEHLDHGGRIALAHALHRQRALQAVFAAAQGVDIGATALRPQRREVFAGAAVGGRPLPPEFATRRLAQLHLGDAHLVRRSGASQQHQHGAERPAEPRRGAHFAAPSCFTVYFFASARTAAVRCSAIFASV